MSTTTLRRSHAAYGYRTFVTTRKSERLLVGPRWNPRKFKRAVRYLLDAVKVPDWLPFTKTPLS